MKITIVGAGLAGLLAANLLRRYNPTVVDRQNTLPSNHGAVLRFRSSAVSDATGIPFRRVSVRKAVWTGQALSNTTTIREANLYSQRVVDSVQPRSIWDLATETRWIAPHNFIERMANGVDLRLGYPFNSTDHGRGSEEAPVISTLPMFVIAKQFDFQFDPANKFESKPIWVEKFLITNPRCDIHQTIYNGSDDYTSAWYRMTIHDNELTIEYTKDPADDGDGIDPDTAFHIFGIKVKVYARCAQSGLGASSKGYLRNQTLGKIIPIDEEIRRRFILWLSEKYHIYSLGRFATWRPILLDDVVKDVGHIERLINGERYERSLRA